MRKAWPQLRKAISNQRRESCWLVRKLVRKGETPGNRRKTLIVSIFLEDMKCDLC